MNQTAKSIKFPLDVSSSHANRHSSKSPRSPRKVRKMSQTNLKGKLMNIDSSSEGSMKELSTLVEVENVNLQQQQKHIRSRRRQSILVAGTPTSPRSKQLYAL